MKMISCDLSQIEPRILAWCAGDEAMLKLMSSGISPYQAHAELTMGWTGGDLKSKDKALYKLAKARVLALGYGCSWRKFIAMAWDQAGLDITKDDPKEIQATNKEGAPLFASDGTPKMIDGYGYNSKKAVAEYRGSSPLVLALWKQLDDMLRASIGGNLEVTLPSGRVMNYPNVREEWRMKKNEDTGQLERRRSVTALMPDRGTFLRKPIYGGLLTENLVQATARDVFSFHLLRLLEIPGVHILFTCHDEAVCEVENHITAKDIQDVMSVTPPWLSGCPIAAEAQEIPHYLK